MRNASIRMRELIDGLLEYSRVTTKAGEFEQVDLREIVNAVLSDLEIALKETKGQVNVGSLPIIKADQLQMRQLFQNLIANGLKFHKDGVPPQIKIESHEIPNGMVEIKVYDNGIGFDEQFKDQIFLPFRRLVAKDQFKGVGIGLAVCKKVVLRHHGEITVNSKPGQGTIFTILLPKDKERKTV